MSTWKKWHHGWPRETFLEQNIHKKSRNVIFSEKKAPAAVHHTHTGHTNPGNVIFSEKKAPAAVHHTHTGYKNPRNVIFSEKKAPAAVHHTHTGHFFWILYDFTCILCDWICTNIENRLKSTKIHENQYIPIIPIILPIIRTAAG